MDEPKKSIDRERNVRTDVIEPMHLEGSDDNRGHRAEPGTGVVEGSGAGAGGGRAPEDYDNDPVSGGANAVETLKK